MSECRKCGCKEFKWNPVSAVQKLTSGMKYEKDGFSAQGLPQQDNKSDQVAYRNCMCGHHRNYHADKK